MTKKELIKKVIHLNKKYQKNEFILDKLESIFLEYLEKHPYDTDVWIRLILTEWMTPWEDHIKALEFITKALKYDQKNMAIYLLAIYIERHSIGIQSTTFDQLFSLHSDNSEIMAMLELAKAWGYEEMKKFDLYKQFLIKSISCSRNQSINYFSLGKFLLSTDVKKGKELIITGLTNIKHVGDIDIYYRDITDINRFFDEFYKGIHVSKVNFEDMLMNLAYI